MMAEITALLMQYGLAFVFANLFLQQAGVPVCGPMLCQFQLPAPAASVALSDRDHRAYPVADPADPTAVLTVRDHTGLGAQADANVNIDHYIEITRTAERAARLPEIEAQEAAAAAAAAPDGVASFEAQDDLVAALSAAGTLSFSPDEEPLPSGSDDESAHGA